MTKKEKSKEMYKASMRLYSRAFNGENVRMEVNAFWTETENAAKNREIFKQEEQLIYKHLSEALRWARYHENKNKA